jgi:serine protease DegS
LLLVPDLRQGSGVSLSLFSSQDNVPEKLSFNQAVNTAAPAVVNIYSQSIENVSSFARRQEVERIGLGSGVIMTANGYILTCLHVIKNAKSILVRLQDGRNVEAQLVGFDSLTDLAVLSISTENLNVIPQVTETNTKVGDLVLAIGNPYNLGQTITQGVVSRIGGNGLANYFDFIQTDAVLNEGNSGGALVDSNGYLVGINNANFKTLDSRRRVKDVDGVSFAIPYELAKKVMDEIIANGKVTRGILGFAGAELVPPSGILVTGVAKDTPAEKGGLLVDDIILSINGNPSDSVRKSLDFIADTLPGTQLELEISRNNTLLTLQVVVAELETGN